MATDYFSRIGLALKHLTAQSTVHGPAKVEVERLVDELERVEDSIDDVVKPIVEAKVEEIEGRLRAYVDQQFAQLAATLEGLTAPATDPEPAPAEPTPAEPSPVEPATPPEPAPTDPAPVEPVLPEGGDPVLSDGGDDTTAAPEADTNMGGAGNDVIS